MCVKKRYVTCLHASMGTNGGAEAAPKGFIVCVGKKTSSTATLKPSRRGRHYVTDETFLRNVYDSTVQFLMSYYYRDRFRVCCPTRELQFGN